MLGRDLDGPGRDILLLFALSDTPGTVCSIPNQPIELVPHDPDWRGAFDAERKLIDEVVGEALPGGVHHVGSTAVSGLSAKPIIDILAGVADLATGRVLIDRLEVLEYRHADYHQEEMVWFCKPDPSRRTHHLHLVPTNSARFRAELAFRNALVEDAQLRADYESLKRDLAARFRHDREAYTDGKSAFIRRALQGRN